MSWSALSTRLLVHTKTEHDGEELTWTPFPFCVSTFGLDVSLTEASEDAPDPEDPLPESSEIPLKVVDDSVGETKLDEWGSERGMLTRGRMSLYPNVFMLVSDITI